ncbi:SDR family NAD(P)-dependent oxidoreductase [Pseudonocardia sp.]|jgi:2-hydroxycyclohexanecarboxyl-CoA dehydrogenase|uniref:SDR family NAD(P)-dependent oxidoreductase n=1 Tax=Pseudonocardia sp. TaxID=60912 RepID=UPI00260FFB7B|nr:SDR family NAD(P)-dependent oxidoreductase [Pseudonocardia sp.]MCW2716746.1 h16 [Pseudonocardia sp.]
MELGLAGRVAVVSGGASNIGRAISLALAAEGASVAILDLDAEQAERVAGTARSCGAGDALAVRADITDPGGLAAAVAAVTDGMGPVEVLVNNAGWARRSRFLDQDPAESLKLIEINLIGTMNLTRAVLPAMVKRRSGSVVSIGSDAGRIGEKQEGAYGAAKAGVISLSKTLAREYGRSGVRFNVVCPGATVPDLPEHVSGSSLWNQEEYSVYRDPATQDAIARHYPLGRLGRPEDVAGAVCFLASERAAFITGQTLSVSGGYTMS